MVFGTGCRALVGSAVFAALGSVSVAGCGGEDPADDTEPACLATATNLDCNPEYAPTFDALYENTLLPTCAATNCHSGARPAGGMQLGETALIAYEELLSPTAQRVIANDVQCGKMIVRLETPDKPWSMPPRLHLNEEKLCAIRQWIAAGAPGPGAVK